MNAKQRKAVRKIERRRKNIAQAAAEKAKRIKEREHIDTMIPQIEADATRAGLIFRASQFDSKKRGGYNWHLMFNDIDGRRLLAWWPTNGTWFCEIDGGKGKLFDYRDVIQLAIDISQTSFDEDEPIKEMNDHWYSI